MTAFTRSRALAIAIASLLLGASVATAAPTVEIEPNDNRFQEVGPVSVDGAEGTIQTIDDRDRFLVRLRPQRQIVVTYSITSACSYPGAVRFWLDTATGGDIGAPDDDYGTLTGGTRSYTITTPGVFGGESVGYHLGFSTSSTEGVGCSYRFAVTGVGGAGTDAIDASPGPEYPLVPTAEPNDLPEQAIGPLAGDTIYQGTIDTANDVDQLWVPVKAGTGLTFELSSVGGEADLEIYDRSGTSRYSSASVSVNGVTDTESVSAGTSDRQYRLALSGGLGTQWRLRLTPPASIGSTPVIPTPAPTPTPPSLTRAATSTTISFKSRRYRGRVTSSATECYRGIKVQLRKKGKGTKSYGSTVTRQDGSWTIRRSRIRGKVYAFVEGHESGYYRCIATKSRTLQR